MEKRTYDDYIKTYVRPQELALIQSQFQDQFSRDLYICRLIVERMRNEYSLRVRYNVDTHTYTDT